ncbi:hypothetical protein H8957_011065, partial [Semnopithecus entellus]
MIMPLPSTLGDEVRSHLKKQNKTQHIWAEHWEEQKCHWWAWEPGRCQVLCQVLCAYHLIQSSKQHYRNGNSHFV